MTDKLIIHGVDVSRCEFFFRDNINGIFTQELCACMEEHTGTNSYKTQCLDNPNCYYKQLQAKEQEIKSLQGELWAEKKILTELDQENTELKEHDSESWKNVASTYKVEYRKAEEKLSQIAELADSFVFESKVTSTNVIENPNNNLLQQIKQKVQGE